MSHRSTGEWSLAVRQQASVARLGQLGLQGIDIESLVREALESVVDTLAINDIVLLRVLPGWRELQCWAGVVGGHFTDGPTLRQVRVPAGRASLPGFTVMQGGPVAADDLTQDQRFDAHAQRYGLDARAAVAAPVGWGEHPWGVLTAFCDVPRAWTDDDVHYVQSVANTLGLAVQRQRVEQELRGQSIRLDLSLSAGGLGSWSWDFTRGNVELSTSAKSMYGVPETFGASDDSFLDLVHPDDRLQARGVGYEAVQSTGEYHHVFRTLRPADGQVRWIEAWGRLIEDDGEPPRLVGVSADITERRLAEAAREASLAREQAARVAAEQAQERLALLAEASSRFATSLDPEVTVASLADICVPFLADACIVDLLGDGGELAEGTATAGDDDTLDALRRLRLLRAGLSPAAGLWSEALVAREGRSQVLEELGDDAYRRAASDGDHLELYRRLGPRSALLVPLMARGRVIGVLTLVSTRARRRYQPDVRGLVEELATRAALAIDNAMLFASRNRVARTLQQTLLPPALPRSPWLDLGARYRVAEGDIEIGGDFYDVIELAGDAWGVVVGDVCGRGPDAAALTGVMRHSVRAAVVREKLPSQVLAQTNDAVLHQIDDSRFCTASYLRIERGDGADGSVALRASSAGHPKPAVVRADGTAELVDCAGVLLGVVEQPALVDVDVVLHPGDTVVLYTDGVTEARRGKDLFGEARLLETLRSLAGRSADAIAAGIEDAVSTYQDDANDDIAIVVAQVRAPT